MEYTIKDVQNKTGITPYTLRFYEKEGILPFVGRNENGIRVYNESNLEWIETMSALRSTGMPLADIKRYVDLFEGGDDTLQERRQIMADHKDRVTEQLLQTIKVLEKINYKMAMYDIQLNELKRLSCL